jgi:hypothetical protein
MTAFPAEFGRQEEEGENDEEAEDGIANKSRPLRVIVKPLIDTTSRGTLASAAPDGNMMMERLLAVDCSRSKKEAASLDSSSAAAAANGGGGGGQGGSIVVVASSPSGSIDSV